MPEIPGVINVVPEPNDNPPDAAAYQLIVPADAVAPRVAVPEPHTDPGVVLVIVGIGLTVAIIAVLNADIHPLSFAST